MLACRFLLSAGKQEEPGTVRGRALVADGAWNRSGRVLIIAHLFCHNKLNLGAVDSRRMRTPPLSEWRHGFRWQAHRLSGRDRGAERGSGDTARMYHFRNQGLAFSMRIE